MRHKDFGQPTGVLLTSTEVTISTTFPEDSPVIERLRRDNKTFLDPWKTPMDSDSSEAKIFSIKFKNKIVGQIILWDFQEKQIKSCSISYWVVQEFCGRGIGTTAVELACQYAFDELGVDEVDATIQPENTASILVIEKLKFPHRKMVGEQKFFRGRWQGYVVYTVLKESDADV